MHGCLDQRWDKMAFITKNDIQLKAPEPPNQPTKTFSGGRNIAELVHQQVAKKAAERTYATPTYSKFDTTQQSDTINNIIKPKYVEDQSVVYKASGYLKDLLGEGN